MKVLATMTDLGAHGAVNPVIEDLLRRNHEVVVAPFDSSAQKYVSQDVVPIDQTPTPEYMSEVLKTVKPDIVLAGVSVVRGDRPYIPELSVLGPAREANIRTVAILDIADNLGAKFPKGYARPDLLAVPNEQTAALVRGYADSTHVTGNPSHSSIPDMVAEFEAQGTKSTLLGQLGLDASLPLILYGTQPIQDENRGYDQFSALETITQIVDSIRQTTGVNFLVRPHPKDVEHASRFEEILAGKGLFTSDGDYKAVVTAADTLISHTSGMLVEHAMMGKGRQPISYQPVEGLNQGNDTFVPNQMSMTVTAYSPDELRKSMMLPFTDSTYRDTLAKAQTHFQPNRNAARDIADLVVQLQ